MSSSKVFSAISVVQNRVPIGSNEFVERFRRTVDESSPIGQKMKALEERHQKELQETYQKAFAEGQNAGLQQGLTASRQLETELRQIISKLAKYQQSIYERASSQLFVFAFALADKITSSRGEAEQQVVMDTINDCLREILDKTKLTIRVNPAQVQFVQSQLQAAASGESLGSIAVEPDQRIGQGGCVIETDSGNADGRIENQLKMLKERLLDLE